MLKTQVKLKKHIDDSYNIFVGDYLIAELEEFVNKQYRNSKVCIISDTKTAKLFGDKLSTQLNKTKITSKVISFTGGEKNKNLQTVEQLCEKMLKAGFNRKDIVIALGGGITGDIAGFTASIFMRGMPYIQMPSSLLAMVDSSIGGKTGVDLSAGKNLVGTFQQPKAIFINVVYLKSLPEREFNNGMAEIIKHGIIADAKYFSWIEKEKLKIKNRDTQTLIELINRSCIIKKTIVEKDEKESGLRMTLNYGHTIGHAIETLSDYKLLHGEAISIGMIKENNLNKKLSPSDNERIKNLFTYFKLPIEHKLCTQSKKIIELIKNDKKKVSKQATFAIPNKIGKAKIENFSDLEIIKALNA